MARGQWSPRSLLWASHKLCRHHSEVLIEKGLHLSQKFTAARCSLQVMTVVLQKHQPHIPARILESGLHGLGLANGDGSVVRRVKQQDRYDDLVRIVAR